MIATVTLNPAVDKTLVVDDFTPGGVNRVSKCILNAGGKGINVSKTISNLGGKSKAYGILAGGSGAFIKDQITALSIEHYFLFVEGETRTNIKIADPIKNLITDINEKGPDIEPKDITGLENSIFTDLESGDVLILTGSVPRGIKTDIYKRWISRGKSMGVKCILDADGELLKYGLEAGPYLLKPNIHELEKLLGNKIDKLEDIILAAKSLIKSGTEIVVVSCGEKGSVFVQKEKASMIEGLEVDVKSTVGAGDAMVAALAYSIHENKNYDEMLKLAAACGTAAVMNYDTQASMADIQEIINKIKIINL